MPHRKPPPGRCRGCWKPVPKGQKTCDPCRVKDRARTSARYHRLKAAGVCVDCGGPRDGKTQTCNTCREKHCACQNRLREERLKLGLCTKCGDKAKPGCTVCRLCAISRNALDRERRDEWRKAGLCAFCGKRKPRPEHSSCEPCLAEYRARRRRIRLRRTRAAEFRRLFKANPDQVTQQFAALLRGRPRKLAEKTG